MCSTGRCRCGRGCRCDCREDRGRGCCCSSEGGFKRRYQTKAEQVADLEPYLETLKAEVKAVEEKLADLKRKKR